MQNWHRRQAMTLVSQLPDVTEDALLVLEAAKELVETFLVEHDGDASPKRAQNVLSFPTA